AAWNWNQQRDQITDACYGFIKKECGSQPRIIDMLPDWMLTKWRDIEARGGTPFIRKRRFLGVGDKGPADPIPMEPPSAGKYLPSKYPRLEFINASALSSIPPREFYLGKQYQRGAVSGTMARVVAVNHL